MNDHISQSSPTQAFDENELDNPEPLATETPYASKRPHTRIFQHPKYSHIADAPDSLPDTPISSFRRPTQPESLIDNVHGPPSDDFPVQLGFPSPMRPVPSSEPDVMSPFLQDTGPRNTRGAWRDLESQSQANPSEFTPFRPSSMVPQTPAIANPFVAAMDMGSVFRPTQMFEESQSPTQKKPISPTSSRPSPSPPPITDDDVFQSSPLPALSTSSPSKSGAPYSFTTGAEILTSSPRFHRLPHFPRTIRPSSSPPPLSSPTAAPRTSHSTTFELSDQGPLRDTAIRKQKSSDAALGDNTGVVNSTNDIIPQSPQANQPRPTVEASSSLVDTLPSSMQHSTPRNDPPPLQKIGESQENSDIHYHERQAARSRRTVKDAELPSSDRTVRLPTPVTLVETSSNAVSHIADSQPQPPSQHHSSRKPTNNRKQNHSFNAQGRRESQSLPASDDSICPPTQAAMMAGPSQLLMSQLPALVELQPRLEAVIPETSPTATPTVQEGDEPEANSRRDADTVGLEEDETIVAASSLLEASVIEKEQAEKFSKVQETANSQNRKARTIVNNKENPPKVLTISKADDDSSDSDSLPLIRSRKSRARPRNSRKIATSSAPVLESSVAQGEPGADSKPAAASCATSRPASTSQATKQKTRKRTLKKASSLVDQASDSTVVNPEAPHTSKTTSNEASGTSSQDLSGKLQSKPRLSVEIKGKGRNKKSPLSASTDTSTLSTPTPSTAAAKLSRESSSDLSELSSSTPAPSTTLFLKSTESHSLHSSVPSTTASTPVPTASEATDHEINSEAAFSDTKTKPKPTNSRKPVRKSKSTPNITVTTTTTRGRGRPRRNSPSVSASASSTPAPDDLPTPVSENVTPVSTEPSVNLPRSGRKSLSTTSSVTSKSMSSGSRYQGDAIFSNMAFAISFQSKQRGESERVYADRQLTSNELRRKISQAGGRVLSEGFEELFVPMAPGPNQNKNVELAPDATRLGFTALLADGHSRKVKYMQALALGIPCIAHQWATACLENGRVLDWAPYLLCAGESLCLGNAIKSRILIPYSVLDCSLAQVVDQRQKLLDGDRILVVMKRSRNEDKKMPYLFLTHLLGAVIERVHTITEARDRLSKALSEAEADAEGVSPGFSWVYVDEYTGEASSLAAFLGDASYSHTTAKTRSKTKSLALEGTLAQGQGPSSVGLNGRSDSYTTSISKRSNTKTILTRKRKRASAASSFVSTTSMTTPASTMTSATSTMNSTVQANEAGGTLGEDESEVLGPARRRVRVLSDELIIQSLIMGQIISEEE